MITIKNDVMIIIMVIYLLTQLKIIIIIIIIIQWNSKTAQIMNLNNPMNMVYGNCTDKRLFFSAHLVQPFCQL